MPEVRIGVDVGGTFTDVVVFADDQIITAKVPSTVNHAHGVLAGIRRTHLEPTEVTLFSHGTTVGTNALLEDCSISLLCAPGGGGWGRPEKELWS